MDQIQNSLNKTLNTFEQGLNIAGYVPIVSTFSGSLRMSYGKFEVIGAIVASAMIAIKALFIANDADRNRELNRAAETFMNYSLHGCANIMRGFIEALPFASLVTCLPYDLLGHRFAYPVQRQIANENRPSPDILRA
jgi:hypothetical protein